ncbi:MAG: inositol monophosphatase [Actinomycetota bacterium]|nr:inositol monophosphatase [Actinomycetota bacterium]
MTELPVPELPQRIELSVAEVFGTAVSSDPLGDELATVALDAARAAAAIHLAGFGGLRDRVDTKSSATDMVSEVDRRAEEAVVAIIDASRPGDAILGEEGTARGGSTGVRWVVDPLDGTTNFLFGIPAFSVSIAAEIDGAARVGVVIDPTRAETWAAVAGRGARLNGQRTMVATGRSELSTALVATGFGYRAERRSQQGRVAATVLPAVRDLRRFGSAALDLCWVAGGRVDAYYEWGLNPWDLSAGRLICDEAGARTGILTGQTIIASVPALYEGLAELLVSAGARDFEEGNEERHW